MLKNWVVKVLLSVIGGWFFFVSMTIDNIGLNVYTLILVIWTGLALGSVYLLNKYSKVFEEND